VARRVATEEALGFQRVEVEFIEERAVALRASACALQEDFCARLLNNKLAVWQSLHDGRAGITIAILNRAIPDQLGRLCPGLRRIAIEQEGARAARSAVIIAQEDLPAFFKPDQAAETLLGFVKLHQRASERRFEQHDAITQCSFLLRIAAI